MEELVGEREIQIAILDLMTDRKVWSNAELKRGLAHGLPWSDHDKKRSEKRPNEYVWKNRINNALSPSRSSSLYGKNLVENMGRGLHKITDHGHRFITYEYLI